MSERQRLSEAVRTNSRKTNLFPEEVTEFITEFLPFSFPQYDHELTSSGLHAITSWCQKSSTDLSKKIAKSYQQQGVVPIVFTRRPSYYADIEKVFAFSMIEWTEFIEKAQLSFMITPRSRERYVVIMDHPPKEFLQFCSLQGISFHGGKFLSPIFLLMRRWDDIPVSFRIIVNSWFTREKGDMLWGNQVEHEKEIDEILENESMFLVQESRNFREKPNLFWLNIED